VEQAPLDAMENYGLRLDFSDASVENVETILGKLAARVKDKNGLSDPMAGMAFLYGAYIGECIIRNHRGGTWAKDHPAAGKNSYPLSYEGGLIFPVAWCGNRLLRGPEANVWNKYQYFVLKRKTIPGYRIDKIPQSECEKEAPARKK
jgi:hypothetical protein